nr:phage protein [uncultured Mediterranean phage uvMED]BAR24846.1 phage protein [uncultured Mediterranean phage uvMED]BAR24884.1 phage protein [uncultured Mediterranean phage uvMED]
MAREINITDIAGLMEDEIEHVVRTTALEWTSAVKEQTPVDTGRLRNAWQTDIGKFRATITNNVEYAEPVLYGNNLPPSWDGQFRTRQNTVKGFPDLLGKEIATKRVPKFIEAFRRRN